MTVPHYIYKCKHGRIVANCRCVKLAHQIKIVDCKSHACTTEDLKGNSHGRSRT